VISNCVINLSGDQPRVLAEAARVLRPGGRFAVAGMIADEDMDAETRANISASIADALTEPEFRSAPPPDCRRPSSARPIACTSTP
jgi:arsenite methyltransferase